MALLAASSWPDGMAAASITFGGWVASLLHCRSTRTAAGGSEQPMSASHQPTAYGRIFAPREDWLARAPAEEILDPGLAIIDTHHHLWSEPGRYLVDDLLADTASGHNVEATVYIDCRQSYRKDGPVELRPVGEVEY